MKLTYKLIALDIDGTLLNDEHQITEVTKTTILKLHERGSRMVLCTGRGPTSVYPLLRELGLEGIIITHNGSVTVHSNGNNSGEVMHEFSYPIAWIKPLIEYAREQNVHFDVNTATRIFIESCSEEGLDIYRQMFFLEPELVADITLLDVEVVKLTFSGTSAAMDEVYEAWKDVQLEGGLKIIRSGDYFIDVVHPEATKGNALRQLAKQWHIDASEVLAIGNYYNDLDMIRFAGLGIAMENSPDEVKSAADTVTLSNNEDGVHAALTKYCFV
jgi:Cof subfamily protein (haloacid dehalogenase superfamily)